LPPKRAIGVVAPLLPLEDPARFAADLDRACSRVILDHYLIGDGSKQGARTKRRGLPGLLEREGFGAWTRLESLDRFAETCRRVLGEERVGISREGFCSVGAG